MTTEERETFQDRLDAAREREQFQELYEEAATAQDDDLGEQVALVALAHGFDLDAEAETEE